MTSFTPSAEVRVGEHTLYVSQQQSDGTWSDASALTMEVVPRATVGSVTQDDPALSGAATGYDYPLYQGLRIAPDQLEVSNPNGFATEDVVQGQLGDCYLAAALAAVIQIRPKYLNSLVAPLVDGYGEPVVDGNNYPLYKITMYYPDTTGAMTAWTVITDAKLPISGSSDVYAQPTADGASIKIGIPLLEKGFAALDQSVNFLTVVSQGGYTGVQGYAPVGTGGWASYGFTAVLGNSGQSSQMSTVSLDKLYGLAIDGNSAVAVDVNNSWVVPPSVLLSGATLTLVGDIYTYQPADGSASFTIPNSHYYSLVAVTEHGTVTLRNPWGGADNGQFSIPFMDMASVFNRFTSAVVP